MKVTSLDSGVRRINGRGDQPSVTCQKTARPESKIDENRAEVTDMDAKDNPVQNKHCDETYVEASREKWTNNVDECARALIFQAG